MEARVCQAAYIESVHENCDRV